MRQTGVVLLTTLLIVGCAPSLSPLYRDFEVPAHLRENGPRDRIVEALQMAGWTVIDETIEPAITTARRTHRHWGLYRVTASLEVIPMGEGHARVLIHPYREYVWGRHSKLSHLSPQLRAAFLPDLTRAFARQGFTLSGST